MGNRKSTRWAFLSITVMIAWGVPAGWADEVTYWNDVALGILKDSAASPPRAGRDMAIVQAAVYDALNAIDRTHDPLFYQPSVSGPASRESAVAAAAHQALVGLHPDYAPQLNDTFDNRLAAIPAGPARDSGVALGQVVANNMLALRASDGWDSDFIYEGSTQPGQWRPTPPEYLSGVAPHWGNVTPFHISSSDDFLPGPPPAMTSPEYTRAFQEVKLHGAADSRMRRPDQTQIALFWDDPPGVTASPVGKMNLIGRTLGEQQGNTLAENARMLALLNIALADAGIVAWDAKYTYHLWRPEDAIHLADADGNPATRADPDWTPLLPSPAFPEYSSGHSTFGGAMAETLILFFNTDDIAFEIEAGFGVLPGVTRSFESISDAAFENGLSRIYGGIHFQFANIAGLESGQAIAADVFSKRARPAHAPAPGAAVLAFIGVAALLKWKRRRPRQYA
jgi:hypothetical protein